MFGTFAVQIFTVLVFAAGEFQRRVHELASGTAERMSGIVYKER